MTEFKVGDQARHKDVPDITGEVYKTAGGFVYFKAGDGNVGYPRKEVEHVRATEEDWEDDAWSSTDELAELRGWAKGVRDMAAAEKKSAPTGPYAASGYVGAFEDADPAPGLEKMVKAARSYPTPEHGALVDAMDDLLDDWSSTFDKKQRAYGPKAIANAPLGAAEGLLNRIHDKYSRLVQLMQNPDVDDLGEATADTVKDMGIYCAMLVLVNEGKWPGV